LAAALALQLAPACAFGAFVATCTGPCPPPGAGEGWAGILLAAATPAVALLLARSSGLPGLAALEAAVGLFFAAPSIGLWAFGPAAATLAGWPLVRWRDPTPS